jgi:hypothetical protein
MDIAFDVLRGRSKSGFIEKGKLISSLRSNCRHLTMFSKIYIHLFILFFLLSHILMMIIF